MNRYFECGIRYDKMMENGLKKKTTELYIVDAFSFTEAESRIIEEMQPFISGEFKVCSIKITNISEIVNTSGTASKWYKAKIYMISINEKSGSEKRSPFYLLVNAESNNEAHSLIIDHMKGTMSDYEIADIVETKIMDVFIYHDKKEGSHE